MKNIKNKPKIIVKKEAKWPEFITFWAKTYNSKKYPENKYKQFTKKKDFDLAFDWKFSHKKNNKNIQNLIKKLKKNKEQIKKIANKNDWWRKLNKFTWGPVYKSLILHTIKKNKFPLIDQHTFRAFNFLNNGSDNSTPKTYEDYKNYQRFFEDLKNETNSRRREIDKALMSFGKFIKEYRDILYKK